MTDTSRLLSRSAPSTSPLVEPHLPAVSLIICSRNRPAMLRETVESILGGQQVPAELVLIDQSAAPHPTLATFQPAGLCTIRYVWTATTGLSRGRNLGIATARHGILAFTDDDMFAAPDWFGTLIAALVAGGPRSVVTGRVLPTDPERPGGFVPALVISDRPASYAGRIGTDVLAGCQFAAYRSAFAEVGLFDERLGAGGRFPAAEDNDMGFRLLEAGYRTIYVPQAVLYHRAWRTSRHYLPLRWSYGLGQGGFYAKHLRRRDPYMLRRLVGDLVNRIRQFPRRAWVDRRRACGDLVYIGGVLAGIIYWPRGQRRRRGTRAAGRRA